MIVPLVRCKILEGENFGEMVYTKNWQIIFWRMPETTKVPKIVMIMCWLLPVKWNHRVLLWCVVKMKCFTTRAS